MCHLSISVSQRVGYTLVFYYIEGNLHYRDFRSLSQIRNIRIRSLCEPVSVTQTNSVRFIYEFKMLNKHYFFLACLFYRKHIYAVPPSLK